MNESKRSNEDEFSSFNDFFCRELKDKARPINQNLEVVTSPADGAFSQLGKIHQGKIFQAKGQTFTTTELLGGDSKLSMQFDDGEFATIYLSPKDYHRVHMPMAGQLKTMIHVPGDLFSVNPCTTENVPRLFARNERLVCLFDTATGPIAIVLVGAMIVASIETVWSGQVTPAGKTISSINYSETITLKKGEEMGRFKLGSTVVLLFPEKTVSWLDSIKPGSAIKMGEDIASIH